MAEPTNGATKTRITLAVLNRTIELQGQYTRERLDSLETAIHAIGAEQRVLHDRISKAKAESAKADAEIGREIATLKTKTGIVAGINSTLAVIGSVIAARLGMTN